MLSSDVAYCLVKIKAIDARIDCEVDIFGKAEYETQQRRHRYIQRLSLIQIKEFSHD